MRELIEVMSRELDRLEIEESLRERIAETLLNGITRQLGGSTIYIDAIDRQARDRQARNMHANGLTTEAIARALDCTPKTIRAALRRAG